MTPAVDLLVAKGVAHNVKSYEHDPNTESFGAEAAVALELDPASVFKTLLATLDGKETVVAVVPVTHKLQLKALAKVAGAKKAAMTDPQQAERTTGYVVGGISPLGQRKRLRTFVDSSAHDLGTIHVSAGRRGLEVELAAADLGNLLDAKFAPLVAD